MKTQEFLSEWVDKSKTKWLDKQAKQGNSEGGSHEQQQQLSTLLPPWEKQLIPQYEEIKLEFKEALEDHNAAKIPSTMAAEFESQKKQGMVQGAEGGQTGQADTKRKSNVDDVSDSAINKKIGGAGESSETNFNSNTVSAGAKAASTHENTTSAAQ